VYSQKLTRLLGTDEHVKLFTQCLVLLKDLGSYFIYEVETKGNLKCDEFLHRYSFSFYRQTQFLSCLKRLAPIPKYITYH